MTVGGRPIFVAAGCVTRQDSADSKLSKNEGMAHSLDVKSKRHAGDDARMERRTIVGSARILNRFGQAAAIDAASEQLE